MREGEVLLTDFWMRERGASPERLLDQRVEVLLTDFQMRDRGGSPD